MYTQKKAKSKPMVLSKYTKIYPSVEGVDSRILYSTKNAATIIVPSGMIDEIEKGGLSDEEKETLVGLGFLVTGLEQEKREMLGFISELNALNKSMRYIIVLNLDCNLGCKYCFEGVRKGKFYLTDEVEARFIDFVKRSDLSNKENIQVTFYGGEPLLSTERIVSISEKIRSFADSRGIQYSFSLVTNGTLLTPEVVRRLTPLGLKSAKVTLDGPKEVHDAFRPFKSGAGSFDIIVRNIGAVCDSLHIQVGGNHTRGNYRKFPLLLDYLMDRGLTPGMIPVIKFDPVINESSEFALPDFHDGCDSTEEPWLVEAAILLREEILKRGYRQPKVVPSPCLMELDDSFVVNYDGTLYKCPGMIGRKECCIGDVANIASDSRASHGLDDWKNEDCLACSYLPLCFGGCKYSKLVRDGNMRGVNCRKKYFDGTLEELVAQDVRYNL
jgi:uncharacterized protein